MSTEFNPMEGLLADLLDTWEDDTVLETGDEDAEDSSTLEARALRLGEAEVTAGPGLEVVPGVGTEIGMGRSGSSPISAPRVADLPEMVAESMPSRYVPESPAGFERPRSSRANEPVPFISALLKPALREPAAAQERSGLDEILTPEPAVRPPAERSVSTWDLRPALPPQAETPQAAVDEPAETVAVPVAVPGAGPGTEARGEALTDTGPEAVAEASGPAWPEEPAAAASCAAILARMEREFAEREPIYPPVRKRLGSDVPRFVIFMLGETAFAIPIGRVLETDRLSSVTPLPGAAPGVKGLTNLRGEVVPVIDLREVLGWSPAENPGARRMLVIHDGHRQPLAALVVDQVKGLAAFPAPAWKAAEIAGTHVAEGFVEAVAERESDWVSRLNLDRILNETHLPSLAAA